MQNLSARFASKGDVTGLLLPEHDYLLAYSFADKLVEGQDILSALLNSLPLFHLCFTSFHCAYLASRSCLTGCSLSGFVWVVLCGLFVLGASLSLFGYRQHVSCLNVSV